MVQDNYTEEEKNGEESLKNENMTDTEMTSPEVINTSAQKSKSFSKKKFLLVIASLIFS